MPDLQRYPLKHCLIKYELDIHVFVSLNCLITFVRSLQNCHIFDQIKGTVVNRTLSSLHGESLLIEFTHKSFKFHVKTGFSVFLRPFKFKL